MQDAIIHKWEYVRDLQGHIFSMFERGMLADSMSPVDEAKVTELRRTHLWNKPEARIISREEVAIIKASQVAGPNTVACVPFQNFACQSFNAHDGLEHICAFCLRTKRKAFPHPEVNCKRKKFAKNERQGGY